MRGEPKTSRIISATALTEVALNPASWERARRVDRPRLGQISRSAKPIEKGRGKVPSKLPAFLAAPRRWPQ
jgi:hypothetical protein